MSQQWSDFVGTVDRAEEIMFRRIAGQGISETTKDKVQGAFGDLRFLSTFLGYFELKRSHENTRSRRYYQKHSNKEEDALFNDVAAAAKEIERYLQHSVIDRFNNDPDDHQTKLTAKSSDSENIDDSELDSKLLGIVSPLKKNPETNSEFSGLASHDTHKNYQKWSSWKENIVVQLGAILLDAANCYCASCLYPSKDYNVPHLARYLVDAHLEMDLPTPELLEDIILDFSRECDHHHQERFFSSFISYMIGVRDEFELVRNELLFLLTCQDMMEEELRRTLRVGIKDVLMGTGSLVEIKQTMAEARKTRYAISLARIWSLKTEIFVNSNGTLTFSKENHVEALREGCRSLQDLSHAIYVDGPKGESPGILKVIQGVPNQVESVYQSSSLPDDINIKVSIFLLNSLVHMLLIRANQLLLELLKPEFASLMLPPLKHKFASIQKGLLFLIDVVINKEDEKPILTHIEVVASGVISVLKRRGLFQIPKFSAPKIPGLCFVELHIQSTRDLLNRNLDSIAYAILQMAAISTELAFMISTFREIFEQGIEIQKHGDLLTLLVDVAYQVEHAIGSVLNENKEAWQHFLWLDHLLEETRHVKMQLADLNGNNSFSGECDFSQQPMAMPIMSQVATTVSATEEVMVGLNDHKQKIIDRLTSNEKQLSIISIVGMPGIGKTTLANNVFRDKMVTSYFPVCAWSCVSQRYRKRDLLLNLLGHIISITDDINEKDDNDLENLLHKALKGKRYLIVMDDMWSTKAWDDLRLSFPNDPYGSRILITSRLENVVSSISDPHPFRPLSEEESWDLLKLKIFQEEECPLELLEVGRQIAINCKGLPLAISAIAGLLNRTCGRNRDMWKQIANSVKACRVHDVVRDLCLLRAKDDNFLLQITADDEPYSCFTDLDPDVPLELFITSNETTYNEYRLCFCVNREHFAVSKPSGSFVRSLLFFATSDIYPRCPYDVSFIPINYRRLRVLDLESINIGASFENGIELLVDLRYLAVCGDMESIPASLSNLENLESLLVKSLKRKVVLPETLWRMRNLRHIYVTKCVIFTWRRAEDGDSSQLLSLVSLSFPCLTCGEATAEMMMRFPNIRKLRCIVLKPVGVSMGFSSFPAFSSLCKLESLNMSYHGKALNAGEVNFPSGIKKLTLSNFRLPWSQISVIGRLPNLEVLKLGCRSFEGSTWRMEEGEFLNLKYLKLDALNIVHWDASVDNLLPQLQQLIVQNCEKLEEIPSDLSTSQH
ncbi:OLC1v1008300C1 [Oldenlandia corymbosa var. corymbosa]|uniref:OLC1v1008300C1 n=1 Tax=Oldenlandia corymbosa var. corymbosa TaxID=529605 RepID=A0AAV1DLA9_OLDCO|nr:OLC1v1008300C1 [Oldenlandia corymbosa var. corymbosa]